MPASNFNIGGVEGQIAALNTQIANLIDYINIDETTSANANINLANVLSNAYLPILFKGNIYNQTRPVYAIFGEWDVANGYNAMKVYDYDTSVGQLANTRIVGRLYYIKPQ